MTQELFQNSLPGFAAQNSLAEGYHHFNMFTNRHPESNLSLVVTPADYDSCYLTCIQDCPPGRYGVACRNNCRTQ